MPTDDETGNSPSSGASAEEASSADDQAEARAALGQSAAPVHRAGVLRQWHRRPDPRPARDGGTAHGCAEGTPTTTSPARGLCPLGTPIVLSERTDETDLSHTGHNPKQGRWASAPHAYIDGRAAGEGKIHPAARPRGTSSQASSSGQLPTPAAGQEGQSAQT